MECILTSAYEANNILIVIKKYIESLNEKSDLEKVKIRLKNDFRKLLFNLVELDTTLSYDNKYALKTRTKIDIVRAIIMAIESEDSIEKILEHINLEELQDTYLNYNLDDLSDFYLCQEGDSANAADLNLQVLDLISRRIKPNSEIKLFDPRCKRGSNARILKRGIGNIQIFGSEKNVDYANNAKEHVDRCIKGGLEGAKISNEVFDAVFVVPEISYVTKFTYMNTVKEKKEREAIRNTIKYLRPDGLYIYSLPHYRLTREIAFVLSKNLSDVTLIRHDTSGISYVTVLGYKNPTKEVKQDIYDMLTDFMSYADISPFNTMKEYEIAGHNLEVKYFRGSILDDEELSRICESSGIYDSFWEKQFEEKSMEDTRPLLPFNIGQVGLVLTSGCLDGVIEEYRGQYHAIKGMVVKARVTETSDDYGKSERVRTEKFTNVVKINIMTPNGEFIELA